MSINELNVALQGGARGNRFRLEFALPSGVSGKIKNLNILTKSTTIPGIDNGTIEYKYMGQTARMSGDRVVAPTWTPTLRLPSNAKEVLEAFYQWEEKASPRDGSIANPSDYQVDIIARQLGINNEVMFSWKLKRAYCSNVPEISFDAESGDAIMEFAPTITIDDIERI